MSNRIIGERKKMVLAALHQRVLTYSALHSKTGILLSALQHVVRVMVKDGVLRRIVSKVDGVSVSFGLVSDD